MRDIIFPSFHFHSPTTLLKRTLKLNSEYLGTYLLDFAILLILKSISTVSIYIAIFFPFFLATFPSSCSPVPLSGKAAVKKNPGLRKGIEFHHQTGESLSPVGLRLLSPVGTDVVAVQELSPSFFPPSTTSNT